MILNGPKAAGKSILQRQYLPVSVLVESFHGAVTIRLVSPFPNTVLCHWRTRTIAVQPGSVRVLLGELPPGEPIVVLAEAEGEES